MNLFKGFKIRSKIIIACATLISITLIVTAQSIRSNNIANKNFEKFYHDRFMPVKQLSKIMVNLLQIRINTLISLIEAKNGNWDEVEKRSESSIQLAGEYSSLWKEYSSAKMTDVEKKLADEWAELAKKPREIRSLYMQKLNEKDFKSAEIHLAEWLTAFRPLRDKTEELIILQQDEGENINAHIIAVSNQNMTMTIIILAASLIAGSLISFFLSRGIMQQLGGEPEDVMIIAGKVASGDLTVEVIVKEGDTKSAMSALKKMVAGLETLISGIISSSQNLAQGVEHISEGNQNMSQRTSEQASSLKEIAATTEEAAASINQNFQYALEAKTVSEEYANLAKNGGILVMEAVSAMNEIDQTSSKISEITTAINEIAFQTNLLALNAAVEAARAGEQGRGFAVVAGEVRNLAQRAGVSAKDIGKLIQLSLDKIQIGTEKVNESGEALKEMMSAADKISSMVSEITASSNQQKQGIEQINKAITDMYTMTQQNAALVEEIASDSEEMSSQAQGLESGASVFTLKEVSKLNISGREIEEKKYLHLGKTQSVNKSINGNVFEKKDNKLLKKNIFNNEESSFHVNELLAGEGFEKF